MYSINLLTLSLLLSLTACSSYQEGFDCPAGVGVGCQSLSTVDQMIECGQLPKPIPKDDTSFEVTPSATNPTVYHDSRVYQDNNLQSSPPPIMRISEQSVRVWIKGYTDGQENYHDHAVIYTVVQPASWQVDGKTPNKALQTAPTMLPTTLHVKVPYES